MTEKNKEEKKTEQDYQIYVGHKVPKTVFIWWIVFFVFMFSYFIINVVPDLKIWLSK
jgi:hypothetical protein